jgi:L-fuconate dehydratase
MRCQVDACRLGGFNEVIAVLLLAHKFGVAVCPHAGGVGLCEYVRHVSMIDFVVVSGSIDGARMRVIHSLWSLPLPPSRPSSDRTGRVCESTTHLHEHFFDTERFLVNGHYQAPKAPGYANMRPESIAEYTYPTGAKWVARLADKK